MRKIETKIDGLFIIKNEFFNDNRGWFMENWNIEKCKKNNLNINFKQDNISMSKKKCT